ASTLTDTREDRCTTEVLRDTTDHFLNEYGLADTGTTKERDLATPHVRSEQIDHLQPRLEHLGATLQRLECRRVPVNTPVLEVLTITRLVEAVAQRVEHVPLDLRTDRYRDGTTGVG